MNDETKFCRACKQGKPISEYYSKGTYVYPLCKPCHQARDRLNKRGFSAPEGHKECIDCGLIKPLSDFSRHASTADGHRNSCKPCVDLEKIPVTKKPAPLSPVQTDILRALRQNGLRYMQISDRLGGNIKPAVYKLTVLGLIKWDGNGFYELTPSGRAACPCRNPYFAKRLQAQAQSMAKVQHRAAE